MKRFLALVSSFIVIATFSSCGVPERMALDENLHNVIEYIHEEDEVFEGIRYQDNTYRIDELGIFMATDSWNEPDDNDILISWNGLRMGYIHVFYSDKADSPTFIYETALSRLYLHKNYDYMSDVFVIEDTDVEVLFSDMFSDFSECDNFDFSNDIRLELHSKEQPRIKTTLKIESNNGGWYISFLGTDTVWECSGAFVGILKQNKII